MPSLPTLIAASTAGAMGIVLLVVALVDQPLARRPGRAALPVCGVVWCLGAVATLELAAHGHRLAAVAAGGVAACGAAGVVALIRARPRDDDGGGGGGVCAPGPPSDPGGPAVDWPAFEQAFWEHVEDRVGSSATA